MKQQEIIISQHISQLLSEVLNKCSFDKLYILTDEHTYAYCLPLIKEIIENYSPYILKTGAEDIHKNLDTLAGLWTELSQTGATRHSLLINLGGGMITDLGGFAASTFKRGMDYINIPTTLLAMVDASVGGKTGINFNGLKNEIGVFSPASAVLIETEFLKTLDHSNFVSGYAEMLKHGLISTEENWNELLNFDTDNIDYEVLKPLVDKSIRIKENIVEADPYEKGIRKALNLGHTVGHAFESLALEREKPVLHGYAVAWGMICELYLSYVRIGFPKEKLLKAIHFIKENYGVFYFECDEYETLFNFMKHDKKNVSGTINFTLLKNIGEIEINQTADKKEIFEMLDFFRECMGY